MVDYVHNQLSGFVVYGVPVGEVNVVWKNPKWKISSDIGNYPYIEGVVNTDVLFFRVHNGDKTKNMFVYMPTEEAEELLENIKEAIESNKKVMGIRTQEHTMRWL